MIRPINQPGLRLARPGFTAVEMVLVIFVIVLLAGISTMGINQMFVSSRQGNAELMSTAAVAQARTFAVRPSQVVSMNGEYQGAAALFTPSNEIRLITHDDRVKDNSPNFTYLYQRGKVGYVDLVDPKTGRTFDYIEMPENIGVVGITRGNSGFQLITPPFAVRFNRHGVIVAAKTADDTNIIHYDGDYTEYDNAQFPPVYEPTVSTTRTRALPISPPGSPYDPGAFDPESNDYDPSSFDPWDEKRERYKLPFEVIETVLGIVVYDKSAFWKYQEGQRRLVVQPRSHDWRQRLRPTPRRTQMTPVPSPTG